MTRCPSSAKLRTPNARPEPQRRQFGRPLLSGGFAVVGALLLATVGSAQTPPDLNILALQWAHGAFISPVLCDVSGEPIRGARHFRVEPGPRSRRPPVARLVIDDLDAEEATRCFDELGTTQSNIVGHIEFRLLGHSRPDLAARDFATRLRRTHGFEFSIAGGKLEVGKVGEARRGLAVRGGKLRIHEVGATSDLSRVLRDLRGRKLLIEIEAPDGTILRLPAVGAARLGGR